MKTIKRISLLLTVLLLAVMCFAVTAGAETIAKFDYEGISYEIYSIGMEVGIAVTNVDEEISGVVTLPQNFDDVEVKRISSKAFLNCTAITEIIIPSTVYKIGDKAFSGCTSLEAVTLGSGVKDIGEKLFSGCTSLEKITIAEGNSAYSIGADGAVYNLKKTVLVYCPSYAVGESYSIGEGVITVKSGAFCDCTELKRLDVASTVDNIEAGAFAGSAIYDDQTNWENGALYVGGCLIEINTSEDSFEIREGTTKIAQKAFASSEATTVIFPESMEKIADNGAFYGSKVKKCYVPSTVGEIDRFALSSLTVYYEGTEEQWNSLSGENGISASGVYFNHPEAAHSFTDYQSDNNATIFLDGTKTAYCDYGCGESDTLKDEGSMLAFGKPESVTSETTTSSITLNWTSVEGATGYRVFYKTASGWKTCATLTATTHSFYKLKPAAKYSFAVRAYNITDDTVTWANSYTTHEATTQAVAPAKITVAQNTSALRLTWTACPGATGYRIYYKSGNSWKIALNTTSATTHTFTGLKAGSKFTVAVRPYIKLSDRVVWSDYTTYDAATLPVAPKVSAVSTLGGSVTVSWSAVNGAEGYQLFFKVNNGSYKLYKTYTSAQKLTFNGLVKGAKYTFAVRAYKKTTGGYIFGAYKPVSATIAYKITRYSNVFKSGTFMMVVDDPDLGEVTQAMKNGNMYIRSSMDGMDMTLVYKKSNEKWYMIMHDLKKYTVMPEDMLSDMDVDELNEEMQKDEKIAYKTSYVTVKGKKLECESGKNSEGDTYKYYFDGDTLVISQTVSADGETTTTYFKSITNKVSDSLFKIPSGYAYMEMEWLFNLASEAL